MKGIGWFLRQLEGAYVMHLWLPFCVWLMHSWWTPYLPFLAIAAALVALW